MVVFAVHWFRMILEHALIRTEKVQKIPALLFAPHSYYYGSASGFVQ